MSEIRIPYQDEDDLVIEVVDAARETLDGDELRVTERLVWHALERGVTRAGALLEELETAGREGRRQMVDKARESLGMITLGAEEADKEFERVNAALPPSLGPRFMVCAAENCNVYPLNELGVPVEVADRVWWCDQHKDQAGPEDHLPPEPKYVIDPATMSLRAVGAERERLLKEEEERVAKVAERTRIQREEAERVLKLEREWQEKNPPVLFGGPRPQ